MPEGGVGEAKEVNHIEEVVAKDAAFDGAGHLIDGAVDDANQRYDNQHHVTETEQHPGAAPPEAE